MGQKQTKADTAASVDGVITVHTVNGGENAVRDDVGVDGAVDLPPPLAERADTLPMLSDTFIRQSLTELVFVLTRSARDVRREQRVLSDRATAAQRDANGARRRMIALVDDLKRYQRHFSQLETVAENVKQCADKLAKVCRHSVPTGSIYVVFIVTNAMCTH